VGEPSPPPTRSDARSRRDEHLALYKTAIEEYRFEVNLGWERQKFFIGLNVLLLAGLAGFAKLGAAGHLNWMLALAFVMSAISSFLGAFVVLRSHRYYTSARTHFQRIEKLLGFDTDELALVTTPGMREGHDAVPRIPRLKVVHASVAVLVLLACLDIAFALWLVGGE
jgi:hypothetical protein